MNVCRECGAGFHLEGDVCEFNVCNCATGLFSAEIYEMGLGTRGIPKTGIDCVYHDTEWCDFCPSGMHLLKLNISLPELYQNLDDAQFEKIPEQNQKLIKLRFFFDQVQN